MKSSTDYLTLMIIHIMKWLNIGRNPTIILNKLNSNIKRKDIYSLKSKINRRDELKTIIKQEHNYLQDNTCSHEGIDLESVQLNSEGRCDKINIIGRKC
ncbi:hypothetical protein A3Q56_01472 [Intoshia linei]|uniref:Uncharacterized protein n=1 Tax=Intoshia linei TaxID=1819745 RepID=A0A177BB75_9BILA|nr:hypothetical protein A3Q56_01472 [Intoshia linei]